MHFCREKLVDKNFPFDEIKKKKKYNGLLITILPLISIPNFSVKPTSSTLITVLPTNIYISCRNTSSIIHIYYVETYHFELKE